MTNRPRTGQARYFTAALLILLPMIFAVAPAGAAPTPEARSTVAGLISAAVKTSPSLARLEAGLQMVPRDSVLTSSGKLRPAADLDAWARSRGYGRVTAELGDALAEGSAPDATTRDWTRCYERGNGAAVICPDGFIEVN
ncbi:MAG: hypothetical protein AVDCRST_MAG03-3893 [uncultured Rubrobacteraceae bacterium]|uniref:Uncharacterized protein n=1 Tax=uncultured Rubrobacteraceae bacterium TaxID=349277 RepID=A0A6J4QCB6_9ACTN|nr:MAG: hypothetical protein AVDCRST_MAG03-3893 [uncultured Rubrobacteraceae bacterium]